MGRAPRWVAGVLSVALAGCATAEPMLVGGRTVPRERTDLAVGAAVRVPQGDLVPQDIADDTAGLLAFGTPSGAAPVAFVRHGITHDVDLGVEVTGSSLRASVRAQIDLGSSARLVLGAVPLVGLVHDGESTAVRAGGLVPLAIALDLYSLYEAWLGLRIGLEHIAGDRLGRPVSLSGLRTGGVVGLGVGFRSLHVLLELAVDHELWWGALGDSRIERNGISLTPAFAVRLRL